MQEDLKLVDLVIELADARIPLSSRNPDIDTLAAGKARLLLLNKADLIGDTEFRLWEEYFRKQDIVCVALDARSSASARKIEPAVSKVCAAKIERDRKRGIKNRPVRAMVAGIPNVGKSTLINSYAGRSAAKTGNRPGVTRGKQWIRLGKSLELLDTPGILWPKFDDPLIGIRLALTGAVRDEILPLYELAVYLLNYLKKEYPGMISARYDAAEEPKAEEILEKIAEVRHCRKKEDQLDIDRAAFLLVDEFRNGKIGKISLELPSSGA